MLLRTGARRRLYGPLDCSGAGESSQVCQQTEEGFTHYHNVQVIRVQLIKVQDCD